MNLPNNLSNTKNKEKFIFFGIRGRLITGFLSVVFIFLLSMIITMFIVNKASNSADIYLAHNLSLNQSSMDLQSIILQIESELQIAILKRDGTQRSNINNLWSEADKLIDIINQKIANLHDDNIMKKWNQLHDSIDDYKNQSMQFLQKLNETNQNSILETYHTKLISSMLTLNQLFNVRMNTAANAPASGLLDLIDISLREGMNDIITNISSINHTLLIFFFLSILISIIITSLSSRSIINPIRYAIDIADRIASGDRNLKIETTRNDETGSLLMAISLMYESIKTSEEQLAQSLTKVRHALDEQSSGSSEQASSINEITASIAEIEKSAFQTMNKTKALGEIAEKTRQNGQLGLESIQNSVSGMRMVKDKVQTIAQTILDLSKQTQQVGDITTVVNNLAQQSKMLALNASIEAAKAGDAGKGFAVVASEVKNLAEQSEQSTTQVQQILESIKLSTEKAVMVTEEGTKGVDSGLELIEQTGQIIQDLNQVIRETAMTSQQIEAAIRQESAAIEQITAGMSEINTVSATFVESIKQTASAMDDLSALSVQHKSYKNTYK